MPSSVSSVVFTIYDPEESTIQSLRAVGGPLSEELGGTSRSDLSGLFSSVGNVPVTYDSANKRFLVQEVTGVSAEVTFDSVSAAIASGSGEIVFNGDFKTAGGGRFIGNVSGNLSGNADTASLATLAISATSALSATNAEVIRNVKFNGVAYDLSSDVDVTVAAGTAVVDFTSVSSALFSATGPISLNTQNFNNVGSFRANNLSGDSVSSNTYRGNTIQVGTASATTSFSGPAATISNFTGIIGRFLTSVSSPNVSADDAKFNNSVSANSLSGLIGRFLTSLSAASVSGTSVNAGTLSATGNTTLGAMTGTTGKFTSEVSSPLTIGSTVSATNIASEGNITSQVGTIQGPVGRFTSNLSATDISGLIGRFLTSLSAASVTGTNIVATNATSTNFTGTAINTGSLAATSNLSVVGNIDTSGDITATGNGQTIKGETVSSTNSYTDVAEAATVIVTNGLTSPSLSATDLKGISVSSQTDLYATNTISNSLSSTNLSSNDARFTNSASANSLSALIGRFLTSVSSPNVSADDAKFNNSASANSLSALIGRFLTSVSAASVSGTTLAGTTGNIATVNATNATAVNFTATNATATNFTGTSVNAGTVTATGDISTTTTITAANIRGTLSVSSPSVTGTSVNAGTLAATGNSTLAAVTATGATINGNLATTGTFNVTGDSTLGGNLFLTDGSKQIRNQGAISNTGAATFGGDVTVSNNGATFKVGSSAGSGITKLIGTLSALAIANESITVNQLTPRILFNSTTLSLRSSGSPSINTCQANQNIEIGNNGVVNNLVLGSVGATSSISLDSSGSIFLDTPNGNTSGQSARFTSGVFNTVSATTYLNVPGGGGDANATSIEGVPTPTATAADHNKVLTYLSGAGGQYTLTSKIGQATAVDIAGGQEGDGSQSQLVVGTSGGGGTFVVSGLPTGSFLVTSGNTVVPAYLPAYLLRYFGTNTSAFPQAIGPTESLNAEGQILYYDATNQRWTNTGDLKVVGLNNLIATNLSGTGTVQGSIVSATNYVNLPSSTIVWASANYATLAGSATSSLNAQQAPNGFVVTGTVSATTVSATTYLNVRPYVSAVDSATTTTVNINGDYDTYLVNTTTTGVTLYLPDASAYNNKKITVSKIDDGGSYRSVTLSGTQLQTATNTVLLYDPTESVTVISNGTNWYSMDYDRAYGVVVVCKNSTGSTLAKGTPVRVAGATGANVLIEPVSAANNHVPAPPDGSLSRCIGVVEHAIPDGEFGHVLTKGTLYKFNTDAYNEGDILYLAASGGFTNVKPVAPYDEVFLGIVTRKQDVNGSILIDVANPVHINDIVGFNLASSLISGDLISYDTATSTFTNVQAVNVSGQGKFGSVSATTVTADSGIIKNTLDIASGIYSAPVDSRLYVQGKSYFQGQAQVNNNLYVTGTASAVTVSATNYLNLPSSTIVWASANYATLAGSATSSLIATNATSATSALNAQQAPAGFTVTGTMSAETVSATTYLNLPSGVATWNANKLQGYDISAVAPSNDQVLKYNSTLSAWVPGTDNTGGGGGGGSTSAQYLTLALDSTLTDERVFTIGAGLGANDAGANGNYTVSANYTSAIWQPSAIFGTAGQTVRTLGNFQIDQSLSALGAIIVASATYGSGAPTGGVDGQIYLQYDVSSSDAPPDAQYLTLAANATLTQERVLVAGTGLGSNDAGAGGNFTLSANHTSAIWNADSLMGYPFDPGFIPNADLIAWDSNNSYWISKDSADIVNAAVSACGPVSGSYLVLNNDSLLSAERKFATGGGLAANDGGANGTYTVSATYTSAIWQPSATFGTAGQTVTTLGDFKVDQTLLATSGDVSSTRLTDYSEKKSAPTISSSALTLDLNNSQVFTVSLSSNISTLTISNPDPRTNTAQGFTLILTADGTARTITWPGSVKWPSGTGPTLTSTNNKVDILSFLSPDNGTTWYGFVGGQNF